MAHQEQPQHNLTLVFTLACAEQCRSLSLLLLLCINGAGSYLVSFDPMRAVLTGQSELTNLKSCGDHHSVRTGARIELLIYSGCQCNGHAPSKEGAVPELPQAQDTGM